MTEMHEKRKSKRKRPGRGLLTLAVITGLSVFAVFAAARVLPHMESTFGEISHRTAEEVSGMVAEQQAADSPEPTVTVEETAGGFYYSLLTEEEKIVYRELLQGVQNMEEKILIHAGENDQPEKVYEYLLYDRPELFFCSGSLSMTMYDDYTEFIPAYRCTPSEREQMQKEIDEAVAECISGINPDAGEYERIKYVYEYLVNTVDYVDNAPHNQNMYSALVGKRSVCAGYSRAAQYLLEKMGIECIYVLGTAQGQGAHGWNIVNCDGKYYQMDVTFGDSLFLSDQNGEVISSNSVVYDYLCCTDEVLFKDHVQDEDVPYPVCDSDDLDYYKMNGLCYDSYDPQILLGDMYEAINAGEEMFVCKFTDETVYHEAIGDLIENIFPQAAQNLASVYGLESVKYTYVEDAIHYKVTVFWNYE